MQSLLDLHHIYRLVGLGGLSTQTCQAHSSGNQVGVLMRGNRPGIHSIVRADLVSTHQIDFDHHLVLI